MFETEFGGLIWFSFVVLALMMLVGYSILRFQQAKAKRGKKVEKLDKRTALERELQAEIDALEKRQPAKVPEAAESPGALEPPAEVKERMDELRKEL